MSKLRGFLKTARDAERKLILNDQPRAADTIETLRRMVERVMETHAQSVRREDESFHACCPGVCFLQKMEAEIPDEGA